MSALLLLSVALTATPIQRIEIAGPQQVTDGWVRTGDVSSFSQPLLQATGRGWSYYHTVLIKFKLNGVHPERYAKLRRAILRLYVVQANNPRGVPTTVAPASVVWNNKATFTSPRGTKNTRWPVRAAHANINYAMMDDLAIKRVIRKPGFVDLDITDIVSRWLYHGLPNRGLLVTASSPIFGMPDAGTWTLTFAGSETKLRRRKNKTSAGPRLILDMEGTPPSPSKANQRALALYPSATLAPIRSPYYFVYYSVGTRKQWRRLRTINVTTYSSHGQWLQPRGVMNLAWAEGGPIGWLPQRESYLSYYVGTAKSFPVGFCGHESNLGDKMHWLAAAFQAAEKKYPDRLAAYYYRGESVMAKAAGKGHIDLLIQEGYTSVHKQFPTKGFAIGMAGIKHRIDVARQHGAIHKQIVMLGHICKPGSYHPGRELTAKRIDQMIGDLRQYAPEMPGIGFYGLGGDELGVQCDRLAHKHFVAPAPEVLIDAPQFEQTITTPHFFIRANAKPKAGRKIVKYRWFIDNRLVAETTIPEFVWDTRGERPGHHFVTVHAIDSRWNRGACHVSVKVE